jgi:D-3-phosphoglycerate dehydrogenase / 2-oxoglutarate reductase
MRIVIPDDWDRAFQESPLLPELESLSDVEIYTEKTDDPDEAFRRLEPADVLILIRERTGLDRAMFQRLPNLKFIAQTGGGAAHVDHQAREEHGVGIAYTPGSSGMSVVELTFGLAIAALRGISRSDRLMHQGEWPQRMGSTLGEKTLSVIGFGRIGASLVPAAKVFGMNVIAWGREGSRKRAEELGVPYESDLTAAMRQGDIISVHAGLNDQTRGMVTREHLDAIRPGSVLINTSRGAVIDEDALIERISRNDIMAGLDVFHEEPLPAEHPLRSMDNVILSPHIGWITEDNYERVVPMCIENIRNFLAEKGT